MPLETKFAVYFSHSWRPRDVDLNFLAWSEISHACELLVDVPEEAGPDPPYYINRIEELLRRSDLFFCVLTHRVELVVRPRDGADTALSRSLFEEFSAGADRSPRDGTDDTLQCSMYSAFEIRLAERFGLPRLILYERNTGFRSPPTSHPNAVYIAFDRGASDPKPDERLWRNTIAPKIRHWVKWAAEHLRPMSYEQSSLAVSLYPTELPDAADVGERLETALHRGG